jgi:hypothetical protein
MQLEKPFVRLPFKFDVDQLSSELAQFKAEDWMAHPSGIEGNLAVPLISVNGENNNHFAGQMQTTPQLARCPYMQQAMGSFGEVLARSRLMRLNAGTEVRAHVDFNYHWYSRVRIHIPIVTNPDVTFYCGDSELHMQAGECWIFDSWRWHNVINRGSEDRIHLVVDTAGSAQFWDMVDRMSVYDPISQQTELDTLARLVPFDLDAQTKLITEQFNVSPVMSPGELEALANELITDFSAHPNNSPDLIANYQKLLRNLAKDWRSIWAQFGYNSQGWPSYRRALESTVQQFHQNPRALLTHSNEVGVNAIIMQRIVRAALHTDQVERF